MGVDYSSRNTFEKNARRNRRSLFKFSGFSYTAKKFVDFDVFPDGKNINWRETMICPVTQLNNRCRAAIHLLDSELGLRKNDAVYITEQVTPLYNYLLNHHDKLIGSEYLGSSHDVNEKGVRNEDLTHLSFEDNSFDIIMSFDCLEHIPDFESAIQQMYRVLKPGGRIMWTVPFRSDLSENLIRSSLSKDGDIIHHHSPEYHGDPINSKGCLCFTHFGWQMLDQVKSSGFSDVYAVAYWSDIFGYLGNEQFLFVANKLIV
jgi:hypothetical protein